jgi:hypothetical protein
MNSDRQPPALALWLLTRLCPRPNRDVITGDILERFKEGRPVAWFWRQVLVAIFVGAASQWKLDWTDICVATAGTALVGTPWELIWGTSPYKPISPLYTLMSWGARLPWPLDAPFFAIGFIPGGFELLSALMVLPLLAILALLWRTFGVANLVRAYFVCAILFAVGDLPFIWWRATHPIIRGPQFPVIRTQVLMLALRAAWIFATLLIAARIARRQLKVQPA